MVATNGQGVKMDHTIDIEEYTAVAQRFFSECRLPFPVQIDDIAFEMATQDLVIRIKAYVYGESRSISARMPANWIEAVKDRFAPAWVKRRWPVQYRDLVAEVFAAYPDVGKRFPIREFGQPVLHIRVYEPFKLFGKE